MRAVVGLAGLFVFLAVAIIVLAVWLLVETAKVGVWLAGIRSRSAIEAR